MAGIIIYLIGINFYVFEELGITPKLAGKSLLWPIFAIIYITRVIVWLLNSFLGNVLLSFGYKYNETKLYKIIDKDVTGL